MSLVNDMLRDLDRRRRDSPTGAIGSERLIPAHELSEPVSKKVSPLLIAGILGAIVLAAGGIYLYVSNSEPQSIRITIPASQQIQANIPADSTQSSQIVSEQATTADAPTETSAEEELQRELLLVSQRMQELEEHNRVLQSANNGNNTGSQSSTSAAVPSQDSQEPLRTTYQTPARVIEPQVTAPTQQASVSSSAQTLVASGATTNSGSVETTSNMVRSPRELSFFETDRQQAQQALSRWSSNQREAAMAGLQEFLLQNPQGHQSRETLAKLHLQRNDQTAAVTAIETGLLLAPDYPGYKKLKARFLLSMNQPVEAASLLANMAPGVAADTEYHDLLATSRLSSQLFADALASYQMLVTHDRSQGRWWYGLAVSLDSLGRANEAVQAYEQTLLAADLSAGLRQVSQQRLAVLQQ